MSPRFRADRPTIVVGGTLGLIGLLVLYGILHFWMLRQDYVSDIEAIQPRTARLLGMLESAEPLGAASQAASDILRELAYPVARGGAATAAAMQQDIRELMVAAGLSVSGSQVLPARSAGGFERLGLDITAEGSVDALDDMFSSLEAMRPLVFVESVTIKPSRSRTRRQEEGPVAQGDPRKLSARFHLFSLRVGN